ncbi:MAG TPA: AAA family ATPase [Accumulibacter sp.]|nr:AAA family ATPase [Accumulibacter sp.]HMW16345.1 AAA family ATPase [Accumulibacter sp.]HMX23387.1 AAA family ATPase [Accumulibacter sp.]HNC17356.1 AAA family ATPase [Accumulibacter sp.]HND78907.1 AAA family ATPase [Accumulibacter sp.]
MTHSSPVTDLLAAANRIVLGKEREVRLAVCCLLAGGHLLIEDLPGVGKTTLAQTLARLLGFRFARIQFTSDMLPADILGVSIFDRVQSAFRFLPGPVFSDLLLADEINRATPKTQSALLEAMEEGQVTIEGETRPLPEPFFVIATQNPANQIGTFPLPESQLDRFLLRIELGYPDRAAERLLFESGGRREQLPTLQPGVSAGEFKTWQRAVGAVHAAPALLDYLQLLIAGSRQDSRFMHGLSPRAGLALLAAARSWAFTDGRPMVLPEDVQAVLPSVARHRLRRVNGEPTSEDDIVTLIRSVALP